MTETNQSIEVNFPRFLELCTTQQIARVIELCREELSRRGDAHRALQAMRDAINQRLIPPVLSGPPRPGDYKPAPGGRGR